MARRVRVRLMHYLMLVAVLAASWVPVPGAHAQADGPSLSLSPSSGPPPAASGSFSGDGWCPGGGVEVGGDAAGAGSISRDGSLDGEFYVTGSAGKARTVKVTASCPDGDLSASARFKFTGSSSGGGSGPSPTRQAPAGPPPRPLPTTGSLTIPGCRSRPENIELEFLPMRMETVTFGSTVLMRSGPRSSRSCARATGRAPICSTCPPPRRGPLFEVRTRLWDRFCQTLEAGEQRPVGGRLRSGDQLPAAMDDQPVGLDARSAPRRSRAKSRPARGIRWCPPRVRLPASSSS